MTLLEIWYIGMIALLIIQQITIFWLARKLDKYAIPKIYKRK